MADKSALHVEEPGPTDVSDPIIRQETKRALVWGAVVSAFALVVLLIQPLLLIFGGLVFAAMLDGGTRLLGRVLPIGRGWRLAIVSIAVVVFAVWTVSFAGSSLADQFLAFQQIVSSQIDKILAFAAAHNIQVGATQATELGKQVLGSLGKVTAAVGTVMGVITNLFMIVVIGVFVAIEPRLYDRGMAWMLPMRKRAQFYETTSRMAYTMRRLMFGRLVGMAVEGLGTWILLSLFHVPMAGLLGLLTGLLAFLPNIGAIVSGVLMVLVGFSGGTSTGIAAIVIYFVVQTIDGYLIVPMVAKRAVDLPPALILAAQLLFGALFGILGLALADPIVAMIKVLLERTSEDLADAASPESPAPTAHRPHHATG